jgi:hypothetical protein
MLTQLAANAFLCIIYIGSAILGLWISGLGFKLNHGEMFSRFAVAIVVYLTLVTLFATLALIFRKRALPLILCIIIAMISTTSATVIGNFNLPSKAVDDYIELREERYEDLVDYGVLSEDRVEDLEEEYDRDYFLSWGWKVFHPVYVITPLGFESDYQAVTTTALFGADLEYTDEVDFTEDFLMTSFYYDESNIDQDMLDDVDSMHVPYSTLNWVYLGKSMAYMLFIGGWGLFIFRKKNMF